MTATPLLAPDADTAAVSAFAAERDRLLRASGAWDAFTRRMLAEAGLRAGQHVLDAGCGAGDLLPVLAQLVGPGGRVTGLDLDGAVATAFPVVEGDIEGPDPLPGAAFDLVLARRVLFHLADPVAALRRLWRWVRPGGALLVLDVDLTAARSVPQQPLLERGMRLVADALRRAGRDTEIGTRMPALFVDAGLGAPDGSEAQGRVTSPAEAAVVLGTVIASLRPVILQAGLADADALRRLALELGGLPRRYSACRWPDLVATWKRKPA